MKLWRNRGTIPSGSSEGKAWKAPPRPAHVPNNPGDCAVSGRWVDAADLREGDVVLLRSGEQVAITAIAVTYSHQRVYNLHVDELQCYAVGNSQVLVHNNSAAFTELGEVQRRALISFRSESARPGETRQRRMAGRPMPPNCGKGTRSLTM